MINMRQAFGSHTTTKLEIHRYLEGAWDEENNWIPTGYADAEIIYGTPIPIGERQTGTHGENLVPDTVGERRPASMKFTSRSQLNLKDVIVHSGIPYKMSRKGDFAAAGYWTNVGVTLRSFEDGVANE